jgi:hypothetical protein
LKWLRKQQSNIETGTYSEVLEDGEVLSNIRSWMYVSLLQLRWTKGLCKWHSVSDFEWYY